MSEPESKEKVEKVEKVEKYKESPREEKVETFHKIKLNGKEISYKATAGTLLLKKEDGAPKGSVFYIAYTKDGGDAPSSRPLTFSFNGGPGSSSVWLHLGLLGPRRILMGNEGQALKPPYRLVENEYSLLDQSDLVFIDPISTGYSRATSGEKPEQFHGLEKDIESVGEFIRLYTTREKRWSSPKFLIGESYGTTRAGGLAGYLQTRYGYFLNGILLVSVVLNFQTVHFEIGNDLPYPLHLPTYTATAWYHGKLATALQKDLKATLQEVEKFALEDYTLALMKGNQLSEEERKALAQKLHYYTGISPEYFEASHCRLDLPRFAKELLRNERKTVGRLDSRFTGRDRDSAGEHFEYDPSYSATILGPFSGAFNDYVRTELRFESDLPYEILTSLYQSWDYSKHQNKYVNVSDTLRQAMCINPSLKIFVANGYYDLATPYFATYYTLNHLDLQESKNISIYDYEAGHMMYIHLEVLKKMKNDISQWMSQAF